MKLLILGGTGFLGPHTVERALERGHEVTLFNRGRTNPHLFPDVEKLRGDRDPDEGAGLRALEGRSFDAVIDTSGYVPRHVAASAELLAPRVDRYLFVSTISVYADTSRPGLDEDAPVGTLEDDAVEEVSGATYGPLKALCERAASAAFPGKTANVRPGLIVGPGDPTDRFSYWPVRIERGGEVLCPGDPNDRVQFIDVRDLADFIVHAVEAGTAGTFNATGPAGRMSIAELIHGCRAVTGSDCTYTWVDGAFLAEHAVAPWSEMTVWMPPTGEYGGLTSIDCSRGIAAGLAFRPLAQTVGDFLEWWHDQPTDRRAKLRAGLDPEKERRVLKAWHAR